MKYIILTQDKELALTLVSHYTMLLEVVFYYYLSSHNVIEYMDNDIELVNELNREILLIVTYDNNELKDMVVNHYRDKNIEVEVV